MLTAELIRQMDTKSLISTARTHANNWFEHALLDRLEQVWNERIDEGRPLLDMLKRNEMTLGDLSADATNMVALAEKMCGFQREQP